MIVTIWLIAAALWIAVFIAWVVLWRLRVVSRRRSTRWWLASQTDDPILSLTLLEAMDQAVPRKRDKRLVLAYVLAGGDPFALDAPNAVKRSYAAAKRVYVPRVES